MKEMETIKRIAEIHLGRVEVTAKFVMELESLLQKFDYGAFSDVLVKLIAWRRLEQSRAVLNIGLIKSEFNFYLLFENSVYIYYEMPAIDIENLPEDNSGNGHSNDEIPSPSGTKNNIERNQTCVINESSEKIGSYKKMSKLQPPEGEAHHRETKKTTSKNIVI